MVLFYSEHRRQNGRKTHLHTNQVSPPWRGWLLPSPVKVSTTRRHLFHGAAGVPRGTLCMEMDAIYLGNDGMPRMRLWVLCSFLLANYLD